MSQAAAGSPLHAKYCETVDPESAYEILTAKINQAPAPPPVEHRQQPAEEPRQRQREEPTLAEKVMENSAARQAHPGTIQPLRFPCHLQLFDASSAVHLRSPRAKTVLTENTGPVEIDVPRDWAGTFTPQIVKKRQRRLSGVDEIVLSLYAKGLTTGEISAHFAEIHGASVSREKISRITDKVIEEMQAWQARPLDGVYAAIFIDAIVVKVRDGVGRQPAGLHRDRGRPGRREGHLGLWAGSGWESEDIARAVGVKPRSWSGLGRPWFRRGSPAKTRSLPAAAQAR